MPDRQQGERQYSQQELEEIVSRRIREAATEQLVTVVKSTVNGLKLHVEGIGHDVQDLSDRVAGLTSRRRESALEMVRELGVVTLTDEDHKTFDVMLEEYRDKVRRKRWWQGRTGAIIAFLGAAYLVLSLFLLIYNTLVGVAHPLHSVVPSPSTGR